jgi:hypothetical protein
MTHPQQAQHPAQPHGAEEDPRYPSPRNLRRALAFTFELLLHFGLGVAAFYGTQHIPKLDNALSIFGNGSGIGLDGKKYFLPTVRMKDVRMLHSGAWRGLTGP